ncbi:phosphatase PAP2 family protein [Arthrobacter sp. CAN_A1]|uniref:phosphatase PAP2 family protein n=1 Tax=Arthrobacter sp. CAN_A1 TaxID=2787717 RepID=UPI0018CB2277
MTSHEDRFTGGRNYTRWTTPVGRFLVRCVRVLAGWIGPHWALLLILVLGVGVAVTLAVASAEVYEAVAETDGIAVLDQPALDAAVQLRNPVLVALATGFTFLGGPLGMPILTAAAITALCVSRRAVTPLILVAVAAAGSLLMTVLGKNAVGRLRPPLEFAVPPSESSPSFPSGHTLNAMVISGIIAYLLVLGAHRKRTRVLIIGGALLFTFLMAATRVYLGHHWVTDVVVAATLGLGWLALVITTHRLWLTIVGRRHATPQEDPASG